jgi:hypothetical protein
MKQISNVLFGFISILLFNNCHENDIVLTVKVFEIEYEPKDTLGMLTYEIKDTVFVRLTKIPIPISKLCSAAPPASF